MNAIVLQKKTNNLLIALIFWICY